jgi:hypothetical protein
VSKGRFLNQKLGKRLTRRPGLLKSKLAAARFSGKPGSSEIRPRKGPSRQG